MTTAATAIAIGRPRLVSRTRCVFHRAGQLEQSPARFSACRCDSAASVFVRIYTDGLEIGQKSPDVTVCACRHRISKIRTPARLAWGEEVYLTCARAAVECTNEVHCMIAIAAASVVEGAARRAWSMECAMARATMSAGVIAE
jgi:hypothetical protein